MKKWLICAALVLAGCSAVPVGNKGIEVGRVGLNNDISVPVSARLERVAMNIEGGRIGLTLVALGLTLAIYRLAKGRVA